MAYFYLSTLFSVVFIYPLDFVFFFLLSLVLIFFSSSLKLTVRLFNLSFLFFLMCVDGYESSSESCFCWFVYALCYSFQVLVPPVLLMWLVGYVGDNCLIFMYLEYFTFFSCSYCHGLEKSLDMIPTSGACLSSFSCDCDKRPRWKQFEEERANFGLPAPGCGPSWQRSQVGQSWRLLVTSHHS